MLVAIRVDASLAIGSGHLMRCLVLANNFRARGLEVQFISRDFSGNLCYLIEKEGFRIHKLPWALDAGVSWEEDAVQVKDILLRTGQKIDWLIVDHYKIEEQWEKSLHALVDKIMVIDDLANRRHHCEMLLDQNYYPDAAKRYKGLVPVFCKSFIGPRYALLRDEFYSFRSMTKKNYYRVRNILVCFGGVDASNETVKTLKAIGRLDTQGIHIDVVVGDLNPHKAQVQEFCAHMPNLKFYCQIEQMAELLARADLAIGAGGIMMWERCFMGVPSIVVVIASNQAASSAALAEEGIIWNLGLKEDVSEKDIILTLKKAIDDPASVQAMSRKAYGLMKDNPSCKQSVIDSIIGIN